MSAPVPDRSRTYHANQAVHLSDLINLKMSQHRFGTERPRFVKVREPDGPSTAGGRNARQAILLTTEDDQSPIVAGFIDIVERRAELKSFPQVKQAFETRFSTEIDLSKNEYNRMLDVLQEAFVAQEIAATVISDARRASISRPSERPTPPPRAQVVPWSALLLAFLFGFLTCWLLMRYQVLR